MLTITASPFGLGRRGQRITTNTNNANRRRADMAPPSSSALSPSQPPTPPSYPSALPCPYLYDAYPDEVGPTANVVLTNHADLPNWLLVARPVPAEEAEVTGGCLAVPHPAAAAAAAHCAEGPLYLCLTDSDDTVYGRAAYIARPDEAKEKEVETLTEMTESSEEGGGLVCTDALQEETASSSSEESPLLLCLSTENA